MYCSGISRTHVSISWFMRAASATGSSVGKFSKGGKKRTSYPRPRGRMRVMQGTTTAFVVSAMRLSDRDGRGGNAEEGDEDAGAFAHVLVRQIVKGRPSRI